MTEKIILWHLCSVIAFLVKQAQRRWEFLILFTLAHLYFYSLHLFTLGSMAKHRNTKKSTVTRVHTVRCGMHGSLSTGWSWPPDQGQRQGLPRGTVSGPQRRGRKWKEEKVLGSSSVCVGVRAWIFMRVLRDRVCGCAVASVDLFPAKSTLCEAGHSLQT